MVTAMTQKIARHDVQGEKPKKNAMLAA